ncbi:MAG: hypothetical protein DKT66_27060 [Candidatus Melainabacteria bacterium]|nr:MAG: hypothetical protein DKT66_27060 [Candidatus Melainabacteria bacterium]
MNIRRLEVLSMLALFWVVLAMLPPWQHSGHLTRDTGCRFFDVSSALAVDYGLAFKVGNLPMLIFGILLVAFGLALLFDCRKTKASQKEKYSCATCSTPYEPGNKFCHSCGAEL